MNEEQPHGDKLIAFLETKLDFARWGFRISFKQYASKYRTKVIYNSEWCRVKVSLATVSPLPEQDELYVKYGRLHAPDSEPTMMWNGEECYCWHYPVFLPVLFLEGYSPEEVAAGMDRERGGFMPPVLEQQWQSDEDKRLRREYPPASVVAREALIWEHYGVRFFELFDLRRPDLWDKYRRFVEEYYRIDPLPPAPGSTAPADHKIC